MTFHEPPSSPSDEQVDQLREISFLKAQLLELARLREVTGDHPLMAVALRGRELEFRKRLEAVLELNAQSKARNH